MRPSHQTLFLSIFAILIAVATAVPSLPWRNAKDKDTAEQCKPYGQANLPQLTWLRDTVVRKVFGLPKPAKNDLHKPSPRPSIPSKLSMRYGGDVVLRFNLTTSHEERMLAEAADTLFLDVWEFTHNWADIRLREDDVNSAQSFGISLLTSHYRFHHYLAYFPNPYKLPIQISCPI